MLLECKLVNCLSSLSDWLVLLTNHRVIVIKMKCRPEQIRKEKRIHRVYRTQKAKRLYRAFGVYRTNGQGTWGTH